MHAWQPPWCRFGSFGDGLHQLSNFYCLPRVRAPPGVHGTHEVALSRSASQRLSICENCGPISLTCVVCLWADAKSRRARQRRLCRSSAGLRRGVHATVPALRDGSNQFRIQRIVGIASEAVDHIVGLGPADSRGQENQRDSDCGPRNCLGSHEYLQLASTNALRNAGAKPSEGRIRNRKK